MRTNQMEAIKNEQRKDQSVEHHLNRRRPMLPRCYPRETKYKLWQR